MWAPVQEGPSTDSAQEEEDVDYGDILKSFLFARQKCPEGRFLSVIAGGNLGNEIWEYMSLYAIARLFGEKYKLAPYVHPGLKASVETAFERYFRGVYLISNRKIDGFGRYFMELQ